MFQKATLGVGMRSYFITAVAIATIRPMSSSVSQQYPGSVGPMPSIFLSSAPLVYPLPDDFQPEQAL